MIPADILFSLVSISLIEWNYHYILYRLKGYTIYRRLLNQIFLTQMRLSASGPSNTYIAHGCDGLYSLYMNPPILLITGLPGCLLIRYGFECSTFHTVPLLW